MQYAQTVYSNTNCKYGGETVNIVHIGAGNGTGDMTVRWSDGYVENHVGCGPTRRQLYLRDRNALTLEEVNRISVSISVSQPVEFKRERRIDEPEPRPSWEIDKKKPVRPRFIPRPEFHARSNPRGR